MGVQKRFYYLPGRFGIDDRHSAILCSSLPAASAECWLLDAAAFQGPSYISLSQPSTLPDHASRLNWTEPNIRKAFDRVMNTLATGEYTEIVLNPRTRAEIESNAAEKPASVAVRGVHSSIGEFIRAGDPCCGKEEGIFHTKLRRGEEFKYEKNNLTMTSPITFRGSQRDYTLMLLFQLDLIPVKVRKFGEVIESNCPLEGGWSKMEDSYWGYAVTLPEGRWAER